jgi:cardiolipin synthase
MLTNLANLLTVARILVIVPLTALLYIEGHTARWIAMALFTAACLTDFFDGYIARSMNQISNFGRFLDPVADKLLVAAVALMLVADGRISGLVVLPALVILMREILVSGLREYLAELKVRLPVSSLAKWKTFIQMIALGHLIVHNAGPAAYPTIHIGETGLWIAAALTLITGYDYLSASKRHLADDIMPTAAKPEDDGEAPARERTGT